MPAGVYHDLLLERLAAEIGLPAERLRADLAGGGGRRPAGERAGAPPRTGSGVRMTPMRTAIGLLLQMPQLAERLPEDHAAMGADQAGGALLRDLRRRILEAPGTTTARLLEAYRDTSEAPHLERLAGHAFATDPRRDPEDALAREFDDAIARIGDQHRRQRYSALSGASNDRPLTEDEKRELRELGKLLARPREAGME